MMSANSRFPLNCVKRTALVLLVIVVILPNLIQNVSAENPLSDVISAGIQGAIAWIRDRIEDGVKTILETLIHLFIYVQPPHEIDSVREMWKMSFQVYLTLLLPLAISVVGVQIMFSSKPPSVAISEDFIKRMGYATLLAYFSFFIIDTLVQLTNEIARIIMGGALENVVSNFANFLVLGAFAGVVLPQIVGSVEILTLLVAFMILALRVVAIYFVTATMPIFCFFQIIGTGPFKKLGTVAEYIWGIGLILPVLNIVGAAILLLASAVLGSDANAITKFFMALGSIALVFAYPFMVQSGLGMFHTGLHSFMPHLRGISARFTAGQMKRRAVHESMFGPVAGRITPAIPLPTGTLARYGQKASSIKRQAGDMIFSKIPGAERLKDSKLGSKKLFDKVRNTSGFLSSSTLTNLKNKAEQKKPGSSSDLKMPRKSLRS